MFKPVEESEEMEKGNVKKVSAVHEGGKKKKKKGKHKSSHKRVAKQ
jgi:hypothetical protein